MNASQRRRIDELVRRLVACKNCTAHPIPAGQRLNKPSDRLPASYLAIARTLGWVRISDRILMGLISEDDERPYEEQVKIDADVFYGYQLFGMKNLSEADRLDSEVFPIMVLGPHEYIVLWTKKIKDGDCPVIHWKPAKKGMDIVDRRRSLPKNVINESFIDWLNELLDREGGPERENVVVPPLRKPPVEIKIPRNPTMEDLCEVFAKHPAVKIGGPATESEISRLEAKLSVMLPESARTYLRTVGSVEIGHDEVCGLGPGVKDDKERSMLERTLDWRKEGYPSLRNDLVVIGDNGAGDCLCLLTEGKKTEDVPVVFWSHEHRLAEKQKPARDAASFTAYLRRLLTEAPVD